MVRSTKRVAAVLAYQYVICEQFRMIVSLISYLMSYTGRGILNLSIFFDQRSTTNHSESFTFDLVIYTYFFCFREKRLKNLENHEIMIQVCFSK